jgi:transposase-like protein
MSPGRSGPTARPSLWVRCPACRAVSGLLNISLSRGGHNHYECEECGQEWTETPPPPRSRASALPSMPLSELPMMKALLAAHDNAAPAQVRDKKRKIR